MKKILIIGGILALVALVTFKLVSNKKKINESKQIVDRSKIPVSVAVAAVEEKSLGSSFNLPASLAPIEESKIAVNVAGKITRLSIENGSHVSKGQIIGTIDSQLKQLNLEAIELSEAKLKRDYERTKELYEGKAATETNMIDAKYAYDNKRIEADQIRKQISDGNIVAPFSGIISSKSLNVGEFANIGTVIATIVNIQKLKGVVYVNEKDAYRLKLGQSVSVSTEVFPGNVFKGKISFISPKGDASHNYLVEVLIENNGKNILKAGTYVMVAFNFESNTTAIQIPKIALAEGLKNPYVYVVTGNKVAVRKIVTGRESGEYVEVVNGLQVGEQIVINGQINLFDGSIISIVGNK
ncbi:efflux RND transporter periplasmic adaptor subunit [Cytophaga aurantiaca]|uniref:efflux RND transporter periplasmic adaptor subunit n=1 Tax=Cytophaga aurantiaca TaxID=29530 RepID=UPI00037F45A7|nr:efflux RND transporter periplasmic adaptor subunit [Cytophaga aurantiaca]